MSGQEATFNVKVASDGNANITDDDVRTMWNLNPTNAAIKLAAECGGRVVVFNGRGLVDLVTGDAV